MADRFDECIDRYNRTRDPGEPQMNQQRIAEALGVSQSAVSFWKNNKRSMSIPMALKLADLLRCSLEELFGLPGDSQDVICEPTAESQARQ